MRRYTRDDVQYIGKGMCRVLIYDVRAQKRVARLGSEVQVNGARVIFPSSMIGQVIRAAAGTKRRFVRPDAVQMVIPGV